MKVTKKATNPTFDITGLTLEQAQEICALLGKASGGGTYDTWSELSDVLGNDEKDFDEMFEFDQYAISRKDEE